MTDADWCWARLRETRHGILATVHAERGVDAVPVVYAVIGDRLYLPIDTVKRKRTTSVQRVRNLERDPRCTLLVDHYDDDWSQLWWVRASCLGALVDEREAVVPVARHALVERYAQYVDAASIAGLLELRPKALSGWSAA